MEIKIAVLIACTIASVALTLFTALSENRKKRILLSIGMPVILAVNTFYPPMYVAVEYFVAVFVCMAVQAVTAFINTRWMRIAVGVMLAAVEIIMCVVLGMFLYAYILHDMH